jgi:hypothetical protein
MRPESITARSEVSYLLDEGIVEGFTFFHHQVILHIDILSLDTFEVMLERNGYKEERKWWEKISDPTGSTSSSTSSRTQESTWCGGYKTIVQMDK